MKTKLPTKEKTIESLIDNLKKAMVADMKAGKNILNADLKKKKTHADYLYAKDELDAFKREHGF